MSEVSISIDPDHASNAFFNITDAIKALKKFKQAWQAPLSDESDDKECYSIGDCLEDIKEFLEQLDNECAANSKN